MDRSRFTRWAAPAAFLAAITIGALVVRAGFEQGGHHNANPPTTTVTSKTKKKHRHGHQHHQVQKTYTVQSGDTLGGIAAKTGTTVARLLQLNPGIDPSALRVGQTIRVQ
jgi:LysM repeat protein